MANSKIRKFGTIVSQNRVNIALANSNVMQIGGGGAIVYQLDERYFLAFVSVAIHYTANRAMNMAAWKLQVDGQDLNPMYPYFIPCLIDGSNVPYFSYTINNKPYYENGPALSANQTMRWSGVILYYK